MLFQRTNRSSSGSLSQNALFSSAGFDSANSSSSNRRHSTAHLHGINQQQETHSMAGAFWEDLRRFLAPSAFTGMFPIDARSGIGRRQPFFSRKSAPFWISLVGLVLQFALIGKLGYDLYNSVQIANDLSYSQTSLFALKLNRSLELITGPVLFALIVFLAKPIVCSLSNMNSSVLQIPKRRKPSRPMRQKVANLSCVGHVCFYALMTVVSAMIEFVTQVGRESRDEETNLEWVFRFVGFGCTLWYKAAMVWWPVFIKKIAEACTESCRDLFESTIHFMRNSELKIAIAGITEHADSAAGLENCTRKWATFRTASHEFLDSVSPIVTFMIFYDAVQFCTVAYMFLANAIGQTEFQRFILIVVGFTGVAFVSIWSSYTLCHSVEKITEADGKAIRKLDELSTKNLTISGKIEVQRIIAEGFFFAREHRAMGLFGTKKKMLVAMSNAFITYLIVFLQFNHDDLSTRPTH
ncbi:unnamed protein product [Notodromas monacha]|uniref:Gustatory receptor n=1 Tax=Notodromas monacha TaxID=399045 RepID=A0A7R9C1A4_9CRUS|nr:unnamed protein product [Notodromas monacha]CAG0924279.1 unnamed protein product [Notodromas monacha]